MGAWDILVIAFGVMVFFVGLTYAELTSAMPQCGGEHVFSYRAMGTTGSFGCVIAYMFVSISFCILRKKKPEMERPYKVKAGRFVGVMAVVKAGFMTLLYIT